MNLRPKFFALAAFVLAALICVFAARAAVAVVESRSADAVQTALSDQGEDWATVVVDGLQVIIEGQAPTEASRFRAMSIAGGIVDASRVIDDMSVIDTAGIAPPEFAMEILRNGSGILLVGLIPATTDREALNAEISRIAVNKPVTDLLQTADYPVPANWRASVDFAVRALARLPRSKISVSAGEVQVEAISDSVTQQRQLETELSRSVPSTVRLGLTITAPRPVISPFTVRFVLDADGARFDACSADTVETKAVIVAAATAAGMEGQLDCRLGLGVPSLAWGEAVAMAIGAVADLGGGTVTFSNADVSLVAAEGTAVATFDRVIGELANALPDVFALEATLPIATEAAEEGPPEFSVTLSPEGLAQLRGRVPDDLMNTTVENFAQAQFGLEAVTMGTRVAADGLPQGWSIRVLAGIEALGLLNNGSVLVQPDLVTIRGNTGNADTRDEISSLLIQRLGQAAKFDIAVTYVEALDPAAALPTPEECLAQIGVVTSGRKITFEPGSATPSAEALPIIADLAEILQRCADVPIRIAGYTDSQGRDEMNLNLSQDRAGAILDALMARRVPVGRFEAVGYGEANPIADNETEEGREANRRIEFSLITAEESAVGPAALPEGAQAAPGPEDASAGGTGEAPVEQQDGEAAPAETGPDDAPADDSDEGSGD